MAAVLSSSSLSATSIMASTSRSGLASSISMLFSRSELASSGSSSTTMGTTERVPDARWAGRWAMRDARKAPECDCEEGTREAGAAGWRPRAAMSTTEDERRRFSGTSAAALPLPSSFLRVFCVQKDNELHEQGGGRRRRIV
ncbi:hypothetical protein PENSPDRAFT_185148 [Peniophora sp. CONT]|nr:hypothetical protein PENSPDRAFT_185148 [Peniophora sp. CONT]